MNRELVDKLMSWTIEAVLKPDVQQLQDIKEKALQAGEQQLVEFCSRFEQAIQNKQPIQPILKELLTANTKDVMARANEKITQRRPPEDLEI